MPSGDDLFLIVNTESDADYAYSLGKAIGQPRVLLETEASVVSGDCPPIEYMKPLSDVIPVKGGAVTVARKPETPPLTLLVHLATSGASPTVLVSTSSEFTSNVRADEIGLYWGEIPMFSHLFANTPALHSVPVAGGDQAILFVDDKKRAEFRVAEVYPEGDQLFWVRTEFVSVPDPEGSPFSTKDTRSTLMVSPRKGGAPRALYRAAGVISQLRMRDGVSYFVEQTGKTERIASVPASSAAARTLATAKNARSLVTDGERVYWVDDGHRVVSVERIGGAVKVHAEEKHEILALALDGESLWFSLQWPGEGPNRASADSSIIKLAK